MAILAINNTIVNGDADGEMLFWDNTNNTYKITNAPADGQIPVYVAGTKNVTFQDPVSVDPTLQTVASSATIIPNVNNGDNLTVITAQAVSVAFQAPTSTTTLKQGRTLLIRIKDNGVAQAISWDASYRAGSDLGLPPTTIANKTMYIKFVYNLTDVKWDLLSVINNI